MSWFSQNSCKTSLRIQYVSFRIYTIWYWLLWRMFAVCGWWHASSNISDIRNKYIVYVMFLSLHYLMSFHLFEKKFLNFKNTKTNFVRSSTNTRQHNNHTWHVVIYEAKRTYKIIGCEKGMLNFFLVAWKCRLKSNINALSHIPPLFHVSSIFDK